mgnify:FL=1
MDREFWYDRDTKPEIWKVNGPKEMSEAVGEIYAELRKDPQRWLTVVPDSLSLYTDTTLTQYSGSYKDGRQLYGALGIHVSNIVGQLQNLPIRNLIYLCLAQDPEHPEGKPALPGWPLIPGQSKKKVPARMDAWMYHRVQRASNGDVEYEIRTKPYNGYHCRHRFGNRLPDPLPGTTYRVLEELLGLAPYVRKPSNGPARSFAPRPQPISMRAPVAPRK